MSVNAIDVLEKHFLDCLRYGFGATLVAPDHFGHINLDSLLKNEGDMGVNSHISTEKRVSE